jgi:predicted metalloprotease
MRWDPSHQSEDLIDRRGEGGGAGLFWLLFWVLRSPLGWVGGVIVLIGWLVMQSLSEPPADDPRIAFVGDVLDDVQGTWARQLPREGVTYERAKLVVFEGTTSTGCGFGDAATGPFYCPLDRSVYIDLSFYDELQRRLGAPGDFAQAYVIAHELGHHVQNLLGVSDRVHRAPQHLQQGAEGLSVRLELQADCYAGVWAHDAQTRGRLELGDIEEAMTAAAAIGDDRLQSMSRGTVNPESFSHGTSAQRKAWFERGLARGNPRDCDTFAGELD